MLAPMTLGLPLIAAWLSMRLVPRLSWGERLGAAIGFGLGGSSLLFSVWRGAGGSLPAYRLVDPLLWTATAGLALYVRPRRAPDGLARRRWIDAVLFVLPLLALCALYLPFVVGNVRAHPLGGWDAWAIWTLRARFLASTGDGWRNAFDDALAWSHPDYPLLLPAAIARVWVLSDVSSSVAPAAIGLLCGAGAALVVAGSIYRLGSPLIALASAALIVVPEFVRQSTFQLADIPVGFFTVLALALLATSPPRPVHLGLAGAAMGLAAWTKNEGLVVAVGLPLAYVLSVGGRVGWSAAAQRAVDLVVGLGPVMVIVALFKILVAPPNDLVDGLMRPGALSYWTDAVRVRFVIQQMSAGAWTWGGWEPVGPLGPALLVALTRRRGGPDPEPAVSAAGGLLFVQLATFFAVYVMTPHSVAWHIQTSWSRLVAQIWPTLVWWAFARGAAAATSAAAGYGQSPR